jgi:hypothetical protein
MVQVLQAKWSMLVGDGPWDCLLMFSKVKQRRFDVFLYKTGIPLGALVALLI